RPTRPWHIQALAFRIRFLLWTLKVERWTLNVLPFCPNRPNFTSMFDVQFSSTKTPPASPVCLARHTRLHSLPLMKAERRHELQTNTLALWLRWKGPEVWAKYGTHILLGVIIIL